MRPKPRRIRRDNRPKSQDHEGIIGRKARGRHPISLGPRARSGAAAPEKKAGIPDKRRYRPTKSSLLSGGLVASKTLDIPVHRA